MITTKYTITPEESKQLEYAIGDVLPYSLSEIEDEKEKCKICKRPFTEHNYLDYFLHPPHVHAVRVFCDSLELKLDKTEILMLKLATSTPKNVMSPKEIQLQLIEKSYNPQIANQIIQQSVHYAPSQKTSFKHRIIAVKLFIARTHFDGFTLYWERDFLCHKRLASPKEKTMERALDRVIEQPLYKKFLKRHSLDAERNYRFVQKEFHQVASKVNANLKLTEEFMKERKWELQKRHLQSRADKPIILKTDRYPSRYRRNRY